MGVAGVEQPHYIILLKQGRELRFDRHEGVYRVACYLIDSKPLGGPGRLQALQVLAARGDEESLALLEAQPRQRFAAKDKDLRYAFLAALQAAGVPRAEKIAAECAMYANVQGWS